MIIESQNFNKVIGLRHTLQEIQKRKLLAGCPSCTEIIQLQLDLIQAYLESNCEMGVVSS